VHRLRSSRPRTLAAALVLTLAGAGLAACTSDDGDDTSATDATVVGTGDAYEATIVRTTDGVPHITGATVTDAAFGQGYASGEDRACDLADQVVKIRGERARWFGAGDGDEHLNSDIQWRAIGIFDLALADWEQLPAETAALFDAFSSGWNAHLQAVGVDGVSGWCAGEAWVRPVEASEVYAYARSIALNASGTRIGGFIPTAQPPATGGDATDGTGGTDGEASGAGGATPNAAGPTTTAGGGSTAAPTGSIGGLADAPVASNGWAIGADRSATGGGMLVATPTSRGRASCASGRCTSPCPARWTLRGAALRRARHRHRLHRDLRLDPHRVGRQPVHRLHDRSGARLPTTYRYGDEEREMTSEEHSIEVLGDDGEVETVTHTSVVHPLRAGHRLPGIRLDRVSRDHLPRRQHRQRRVHPPVLRHARSRRPRRVHRRPRGAQRRPAVQHHRHVRRRRAWYADTSATPNLSEEALAAYEERLGTDAVTRVASENGAVLLDGSDPLFEWVDAPGARDPGLVPFDAQPQLERSDYVFNANDSFWVAHATELLDGDHSPLHGRQETARSPRTRENAVVLDDTSPEGASGADGAFTLDELADAALANRGYTSRVLLGEVVARCEGIDLVSVTEVPGEDGEEPVLPAADVAIADACDVLARWDGVYDLDRAGPPLWRELMSRYEFTDLIEAGALWDRPFDPSDPIGTPAGLAPASGQGDLDLVLEHLARAVQILDLAGFAPDVTLGDAQFAIRNGERVPIHGGGAYDGVTNIVGFGRGHSILDPTLGEVTRDVLVGGSALADVGDGSGYLINNGTSFLLALAYGDAGPEAKVFLAYSNTEDRSADDYTAATERFSAKDWRNVAFTAEAVAADARSTITVRG
jgi:acyl-homoserine-lactone acylase